jgi:exosome complex component RRP42
VPRTRAVAFDAKRKGAGATRKSGEYDGEGEDTVMYVGGDGDTAGETTKEKTSGFDTRDVARATDFELPDYWDEGEPLGSRDRWPVCVTLNIVRPLRARTDLGSRHLRSQLPGLYYLDATAQEEASTPLRLVLLYSFPDSAPSAPAPARPVLQGMRLLGSGESDSDSIARLVSVSVCPTLSLSLSHPR